MIKIESYRVDLALYVINLKMADTVKNNTEKDYKVFKEKIMKLYEEKEKIYNLDEETIDKVLNEYLKEVINK